ncbi:four-carbon acid sugar kinase family protein [Lactobacillus sp. UCMA15818]|uniref:four-carbon acid sugar kinase family protein n=1 Tax=Lactobacillus sp. UCMA15818 TaxID=2583394 RepID=UPI0025B106B2|nr:four-carbon acid sugar kinase family protein [Lactobacillus sp. UCMA15818]MDN2454317.1 four-carbon acid sugar kinase family protein [Lactobacillus sp. UCMA15818]
MKKNYLIVADDFTGSNDTGVQLTKRGIFAKVVFSSTSLNNQQCSLVVDTESRNVSGEEARKKLFNLLTNISLSSFDFVMKKVDSTLRGNIVEELQALDVLYKPDLVFFDNALPSLNREIKDGVLYVNGIRGTETDLRNDPIKPLTEDNLINILNNAFPNEKKRLITLNDLRGNASILNEDCRIYAADSVTDGDMQSLVKKLKNKINGKKVLWIGSAGLMDAALSVDFPAPPSLGLIGSVSKVTREQVHFAEQNGIEIVKIPIYEVYEKEDYHPFVTQILTSLKKGKDTIVASSASYNFTELEKTKKILSEQKLSKEEINSLVQSILGGICRKVLHNSVISGLFIAGGDTAKGFFDGIQAEGVNILEEIATGVPMMEIIGGKSDSLKIVTKAGAFGDKELIVFSYKKLKEKFISGLV